MVDGAEGRGGEGQVPAARLVHLAAALLGPADPDHPLRRATAPCRCRRRICRCCCRASRTSGPTTPGSARSRACASGTRRRARSAAARRGARPTCPIHSSTARGISCAIRARTATIVPFDAELTRTWLPVHSVHRRQRARGAAPDVCALRHDGAARISGSSTSKSRSASSARTGSIINDGAKMSKSRGNVIVPDKLHREVRRRHRAAVPDVPRPVRAAAATIAMRESTATARLPVAALAKRAERGERPARTERRAKAAPDDPASDRADCRAFSTTPRSPR